MNSSAVAGPHENGGAGGSGTAPRTPFPAIAHTSADPETLRCADGAPAREAGALGADRGATCG